MKIQKTIQEPKTIDMDIVLPYFCVNKLTYIKVISEKETLSVYNGRHHDYYDITKCATSARVSLISDAKEISEKEFNEVYHEVLMELGVSVPAPSAPKELLNQPY